MWLGHPLHLPVLARERRVRRPLGLSSPPSCPLYRFAGMAHGAAGSVCETQFSSCDNAPPAAPGRGVWLDTELVLLLRTRGPWNQNPQYLCDFCIYKLPSDIQFLVLAVTMARKTLTGPRAHIRQSEPGARGAWLCSQAPSQLLRWHRGENRQQGTPGEAVGKNKLCTQLSEWQNPPHGYFCVLHDF